MVVLSNAHKFAYFPIPKTGSSTMTHHLKNNYAAYEIGMHHEPSSPDVRRGMLCWTVVRNPWVRLISWWSAWLNTREPGGRDNRFLSHSCTFEEFVAYFADHVEGDDMKKHQVRRIRYPQHRFAAEQPCARVIRLENLDEDFASLPFAGILPSKSAWRNKGDWRKRGSPRDHYTPSAKESAVRYGILEECEALGYPTEIPE